MRIKARLLRFSVFQEGDISVHFGSLQSGNGHDLLSSLKEIKGEKRKIALGDFFIYGAIKSISVSKNTSIVVRVAKTSSNKYVVTRLAELVYSKDSGGKDLFLLLDSRQEEELRHLLEKASTLLAESSEDIMVRLSTYRYEGRTIPGERSVYQLSQRRQEVVISRLKEEIKGKEGIQCSGKN
jgi:hypothetical protein